MSLYNAVFALNENDRQTINVRCPNVKVFTSPFAVTDNQVHKIDIGSFRPLHLVFMGGENHFPNYDGLEWFLREVIPLLKMDLPNLYVTGNWKDETISEFSKYYHKIIFTGFVADLAPYLSNSISIVPIRIGGGGIRTKILFVMSNNVPVVSTTLGCVGIEGVDNVHFSIADSALEFAERISDLIKNPTRAKQIIQNAQELIDSVYSQKVVSEKRNSYYHQIMEISDFLEFEINMILTDAHQEMIHLSIIIINYNTFDLTSKCIASIIKFTTGVNYEIILVDNALTEREPEEFQRLFSTIKMIKNSSNLGFAGGNNSGLKIARGDIVLLLNSDVEILNNVIGECCQKVKRMPLVGVITCKLVIETEMYNINADDFHPFFSKSLSSSGCRNYCLRRPAENCCLAVFLIIRTQRTLIGYGDFLYV